MWRVRNTRRQSERRAGEFDGVDPPGMFEGGIRVGLRRSFSGGLMEMTCSGWFVVGVAIVLGPGEARACRPSCKAAWSEMQAVRHAVSMYRTDNQGDCPS